METESKNVTNFCHVKGRLLIKKYKTTWIPLRAEEGEKQEKTKIILHTNRFFYYNFL